MTMRTLARWAVPVAGLLVALGCSAADDAAESPPDATDAPATTAVATFCVRFPSRDAAVLFAVPADPGLAGDPAAIDQLLETGANGLTESAPAPIHAAVVTYVAALRDYRPGTDPLADPATAAAVDQIDAWLLANCPTPPGTAPPGTAPPGTAPG